MLSRTGLKRVFEAGDKYKEEWDKKRNEWLHEWGWYFYKKKEMKKRIQGDKLDS